MFMTEFVPGIRGQQVPAKMNARMMSDVDYREIYRVPHTIGPAQPIDDTAVQPAKKISLLPLAIASALIIGA